MTEAPITTLQRGDVFVSEGSMGPASWLIRQAERFWSRDNQAHYGHAGIITSAAGETLEVLWSVRHGHIDVYAGQRVLIARPTGTIFRPSEPVSLRTRDQAIEILESQHLGRVYPIWRIPLHLFPPAAKYLHIGRWLVCSELVAKMLVLIAARDQVYYGTNPDTLADEWICWRNFEVLFEGEWDARKV